MSYLGARRNFCPIAHYGGARIPAILTRTEPVSRLPNGQPSIGIAATGEQELPGLATREP
jgi:hypothetical protein